VIAPLGFFHAVQIFVQLFLRVESQGINALELRVSFLALPVSAGNIRELEA